MKLAEIEVPVAVHTFFRLLNFRRLDVRSLNGIGIEEAVQYDAPGIHQVAFFQSLRYRTLQLAGIAILG